eukprot:CAMPEP_0172160218 /NCGR_PEP_ID=MMETSP1050-20130122/5436_1 /TAXON_ID=233186 /ORGANISM="Cryptomonas curvata, Strain CCAP979/52" /LENGTH=132 /DNA_ID=CAMNT_0012829957 /DNA_START=130 /DNA_END=525 /DNA_ORIENTATION=-
MFGLYTHCQPLREPGVPVAIRSKRLCGTAPPVKGESEATAEPGKPGEGWALPPLLQWQRLRYQAPRRFISQSQASLLFAASKWLICIKIPPAPTRKTEAASHQSWDGEVAALRQNPSTAIESDSPHVCFRQQ